MQKSQSVICYTSDQRDCLQEICNIVTGQTADVLARNLNVFVNLPIPQIRIIDVASLSNSLEGCKAQSVVCCAAQRFYCEQDEERIDGIALLLSPVKQSQAVVSGVPQQSAAQLYVPVIETCLHVLGEQCGMPLHCEASHFVESTSVERALEQYTAGWHKVLIVEMNHQIENDGFESNLLLLFPDQAIITMAKKLDDLLEF